MRVILEIPLDRYHTCLPRFPLNSREYRALTNGVIARNEVGDEVIQILCESEIAKAVQKLFAKLCPEALDTIKELPEKTPS